MKHVREIYAGFFFCCDAMTVSSHQRSIPLVHQDELLALLLSSRKSVGIRPRKLEIIEETEATRIYRIVTTWTRDRDGVLLKQ
jgi:hypothetical protein